MKNGILRDDEGYKILVDGHPRTFRDQQQPAYAAALLLKQRWPTTQVQILDLAKGVTITMKEDGRTD